jgi:predicted permease
MALLPAFSVLQLVFAAVWAAGIVATWRALTPQSASRVTVLRRVPAAIALFASFWIFHHRPGSIETAVGLGQATLVLMLVAVDAALDLRTGRLETSAHG